MKKNLIDIRDFSIAEVDRLISLGKDIIAHGERYASACHGKKLATLFFEPSTRTRLSFESAMMELGGNVIGFSSASSSSASKGESVADTAQVISCFADIIAMRHPKEGAPMVASLNASIPVINAGDGGHNHPTQTLTDLLTISRQKGRLNNMVVGCCGDLKYGRTVHSLVSAMSRYEGVKFVFIAPDELRMPVGLRKELDEAGVPYVETTSLEEVLPELDVLYMTRVQQERFADVEQYNRLKDSYILNTDKLAHAKADMIIMHPLPRVNEISVAVDKDPRACYFQQVLNGKFIRMALILTLLGLAPEVADSDVIGDDVARYEEAVVNAKEHGFHCASGRCITSVEQELPQAFFKTENGYRCIYCDRKPE